MIPSGENEIMISLVNSVESGSREHTRAVSRQAALRFAARLLLVLFLLAAGAAHADTSKLSPDLQAAMANSPATLDVVIQYSSPPQTCTTGLLGIVCTVVNLAGGLLNTVFTVINAVFATLTPSQIISVSGQSNVTYISLN